MGTAAKTWQLEPTHSLAFPLKPARMVRSKKDGGNDAGRGQEDGSGGLVRRAGRQGERGLQTFKSGDTSAPAALAQDGRASLESWTSATPAPGHRAPLGNGGPLPGVGGLRVSLPLSLAQGPTGGIRTDSFLKKLTGQREESTVCGVTQRSGPVVHRDVW